VEFFSEYGIFLAKSITVLLVVLFIIAAASSAAARNRKSDDKELIVEKLNEKLEDAKKEMEAHVLDKSALKAQRKLEKKQEKDKSKQTSDKPRTYVLDFDGDIKASAVETLRDSITAVLTFANPERDDIVVRLESPGGLVHAYGLAAAQLDRIKKKGFKLTACVDKVAASGGYMMACVADRIVASPFAVMGSIGVVAQLPNFNRLLKKNDIDFEILTAGEYKRTLTMFGENTEKGREKFQSDLEETHDLFKHFVSEHRPVVKIDEVANGDIWFGQKARDVELVDELATSDEYLMDACNERDVFSVKYREKQTLVDKLGLSVSRGISASIEKLWTDLNASRGMK